MTIITNDYCCFILDIISWKMFFKQITCSLMTTKRYLNQFHSTKYFSIWNDVYKRHKCALWWSTGLQLAHIREHIKPNVYDVGGSNLRNESNCTFSFGGGGNIQGEIFCTIRMYRIPENVNVVYL